MWEIVNETVKKSDLAEFLRMIAETWSFDLGFINEIIGCDEWHQTVFPP